MRMPARAPLIASAVAVCVAVDGLFAGTASGVVATVAMLGGVAAAGVDAVRARASRSLVLRRARLDIVVYALLAVLAAMSVARGYMLFSSSAPSAVRTYDSIYLVAFGIASLIRWQHLATARLSLLIATRPMLLLALSFAVLILVGTVLLVLPVSVHSVESVSLLDAAFTMTSAVCVTGLTVNDVGRTYSAFGEGVILSGIQLGGIGIMTLTALALLLRSNTRLRDHTRYATMMGAESLAGLKPTIIGVVAFTLTLEAIGAALMWLLLRGDPRLEGRSEVWVAVFHAVSAFCNAGFSVFTDGVMSFYGDLRLQLVLMALIVAGGLGFPVLRDLATAVPAAWLRRRRVRLEHGTRIVLATTALLIVLGASAIAAVESANPHSEGTIPGRLLASLFLSVNARTAGYNTVDIVALAPGTVLIVMMLMFVGGSPASTAGGVKTTTLAVLFAVLRAELTGTEPRLANRAVPVDTRRRATAVIALSAGVVLIALGFLTLVEKQPFENLAFEAVSAFSTTGLSRGVTPLLSPAGKLVIMATMFVGRVGPLTIALAVATADRRERFTLASENVPIG